MIKVPMHFGNPNLGSTPVSVSAVLFTPGISFATGILKGIGASLWTGQPYIEMAAGIGDACMALCTYALSKRMKAHYAIVTGQLTRYIFTSGLIALSVSIFVKGDISLAGATWVAIFPAVTLSIIANAAVALLVVQGLNDKVRSRWGLPLVCKVD
jgi:hypothetical protein